MKTIARQSLFLLLGILVLYLLLLALSLLLVPPQRLEGGLDSGRAGLSLYLTEPKYVFLARGALASDHDKVIVLGASNAVVGFRQEHLQVLLPGVEVSNLAVGGSNLTQLRQIVELVQEAQEPAVRARNTFVIGLWYGLFADDRVRWHTPDRHAGDTDIDIERYRYGFYRRGEHGPVALLPSRWLDAGVVLIHPWLVGDRLLRDASASLRDRLKGKAPPLSDEARNAKRVDEAARARYLAFWSDYMGGSLSEAQFAQLEALIQDVRRTGGRVVLVDLPLPDWHKKRSPFTADYYRRLGEFLARHRDDAGVQVASIEGVRAGDFDFSDEVHPKPRVTPQWSRQLATALEARERASHAARQQTATMSFNH